MKLYRIRRKDDGRFFAGWIAPTTDRWRTKCNWSVTGAFYQKIDTIAFHLEGLVTDWEVQKVKIRDEWYTRRCGPKSRKILKRFPKKIRLYEVVVSDISLLGESVISAASLLKKKKKKK